MADSDNNDVKNIDLVAKLTPAGVADAVNFLGPNGQTYTLYYRIRREGGAANWRPVKFVDQFPK